MFRIQLFEIIININWKSFMKTTRTKTLFALILFSTAMPSMIFSAEEAKTRISKFNDIISKRFIHGELWKSRRLGEKEEEEWLGEVKTWVTENGDLDLNATDKYGSPPIKHAVYSGKPNAIIKLLLNSNAEVNSKDRTGRTALHIASYMIGDDNGAKVVQNLLTNKADLTCEDRNGKTAFFYADGKKYTRITKLLLSAELGVNAKDQTDDSRLATGCISEVSKEKDLLTGKISEEESEVPE